jgi:hypothetical protein
MIDLVREDRSLLEQAIGGVPYELQDDSKDMCRVATEKFTVSFVWMRRERWIDGEIEVHDVADHPLDPHRKYSARQWLEARGLPTLARKSGKMGSLLLRDELVEVGEALASILSHERVLRQTLFYLSGQTSGYTDRVLVPEQAPPANIQRWAETRFGRLPKWN